jgi:hypothetical protein
MSNDYVLTSINKAQAIINCIDALCETNLIDDSKVQLTEGEAIFLDIKEHYINKKDQTEFVSLQHTCQQ